MWQWLLFLCSKFCALLNLNGIRCLCYLQKNLLKNCLQVLKTAFINLVYRLIHENLIIWSFYDCLCLSQVYLLNLKIELVTVKIELVTVKIRLVTAKLKLVTKKFDLPLGNLELLTVKSDLLLVKIKLTTFKLILFII